MKSTRQYVGKGGGQTMSEPVVDNTTLETRGAAGADAFGNANKETDSGSGGGSTPSKLNITVTPALGAVTGGTVTLLKLDGTTLSTQTIDAATNSSYHEFDAAPTVPFIVKLDMPKDSKYYDEKSDKDITVTTPFAMLSFVPEIRSSVGVTALTSMAAKLAGVTVATDLKATIPADLTADKLFTAIGKANLAIDFPVDYNILSPPVPASLTKKAPVDKYGLVMAKMAKLAATDAQTQLQLLMEAVDGTGVISAKATNITTIVSTTFKTDVGAAAGVTIGTPISSDNTKLGGDATTGLANIKLKNAPPKAQVLNATETKAALDAHNKWRAAVTTVTPSVTKIPDLTYSETLAATSLLWVTKVQTDKDAANQSCMTGDHSPTDGKYRLTTAGENLFAASEISGSSGTSEQIITGAQPVDAWGSEIKDFDPATKTLKATSPSSAVIGHYTAIVWRATTEVGCAKAVCKDKSQIWICQYSPAGNSGGLPY